MTITKEWLDSCRTPAGGFRNAQMKFLIDSGIAVTEPGAPFARGWYESSIGREITDDEAAEFKRLASVTPKKRMTKRDSDRMERAVTSILVYMGRYPAAARIEAARRILGTGKEE